MITVTRMNGEEFIVNASFIEFVESTHDTLISLTTGRKVRVSETMEQIIERVVAYEGAVCNGSRFGRRQKTMAETEVVALADEEGS